jgi:hypothetical protein
MSESNDDRPFTTDNDKLTDGSLVWYVLNADTEDKVASASTEEAVTDLEMQLNEICERWVAESPDHKIP